MGYLSGFIFNIIDKINSQLIRRFVQLFFLGIVIIIGIQFYDFTAQLENGKIPDIERPPGVEAFLPISALVSLKHLFFTGKINEVHPSGLVIFILVCFSALLLKKSFCSWICPFGLLSEYLTKLNAAIFINPLKVPAWPDYLLRSVKYFLAAFFVWSIFFKMPANAVMQFIYSPYNVVADIKMLKFFTDISATALIVTIVIMLLSVIIKNFWCRYLCPYGGLLGFISLFSAGKIRRNSDSCTGCGKCDRACPSLIKISDKKIINSDECTACMKCTGVCPEQNTLELSILSRTVPVKPMAVAFILLAIFAGGITIASVSGNWHNKVTKKQYLIYMMSQGMLNNKIAIPAMRDNIKMEKMRKMMEMMNNGKP